MDGKATRVLFEQTTSVDPSRLGKLARDLTNDEFRSVEAALRLALAPTGDRAYAPVGTAWCHILVRMTSDVTEYQPASRFLLARLVTGRPGVGSWVAGVAAAVVGGVALDPGAASSRWSTQLERLRAGQVQRLWNSLVDNDTTDEVLTAWIAKEELRALMAVARRGGVRSDIAHRLTRFYTWCATVDILEVTRLAATVDAWRPQIEAFLTTGITNAGTEGTNHLIKDAARVAFGFRNPDNQRRRVRSACTRRSRLATAG